MPDDDKLMLEMAAKAVGAKVYWSTDGTIQNRPVLVTKCGGGMGTMPYEERWDPRHDDGLALRLACALEIDLSFRVVADLRVEALAPGGPLIIERYTQASERASATRLAIVRAAAAIGEKMP